MLKIKEFAYFGFEVSDLRRARDFYENILGFRPATTFGTAQKGWVEYELGPHTLAISNNNTPDPPPPASLGPCIGLEVEDFDAAIAHLKAHQVTFFMEPSESPLCRIADILDPDGNRICIHQMKKAPSPRAGR
jgi:predicted enzyme related to lactoylglutathione lyase